MTPDGWKRNKRGGFLPVLLALIIPCVVLADDPDYGYVGVTTDAQDATLYVDGGYLGKLPMSDSIMLPVGKHLLSFLPGSRTAKLYPIGDDVPVMVTKTTSEEKEVKDSRIRIYVGGNHHEHDNDNDRDNDRDRDRDKDPKKVVTTTTTTTGLDVSKNERRIIESATYWVYVQPERITPVFMSYSRYTSTLDQIKEEERRQNSCFWGAVSAGAALVVAVLVIAMFQ